MDGRYRRTSWVCLTLCAAAMAFSQAAAQGLSQAAFTSSGNSSKSTPPIESPSSDSVYSNSVYGEEATVEVRLGEQSFYNSHTGTLNDSLLDCRIEMPSQPTFRKYKAKTPDGTVRRRVHAVVAGDISYKLESVVYPLSFLSARKLDAAQEPYTILSRTLDNCLAKRKDSKTVSRNQSAGSRLPGMEMVCSYPAGVDSKLRKYPAGTIFQRVYIRGTEVYSLTAEISKEAYQRDPMLAKKTIKEYLDSFVMQVVQTTGY